MKFYLGTHRPHWLWDPRFSAAPLFVSHRTLGTRKGLHPAVTSWALDSGGFSELSLFGEWRTTPEAYVDAVWRYAGEVGRLDWASPQDWMCEDVMLAKTGRTVDAHQQLTIDSVCTLRQLAPSLPFIPVLQGQTVDDYLRHIKAYDAAGIDLTMEPVVGVGSVCRRQATSEIGDVITELAATGLRLHGFGVKQAGVTAYGHLLGSSDSMAWSFNARWERPLPGHTHKACNNCAEYALAWRARTIAKLNWRS